MATDADNDEGWGGDFRKHAARSKCTEKESADGFLFSWAFSGRGGGECERRPNQGAQQQMHQEDEGGWKWEREGEGGRTGKGAGTQSELLLVLLGLLGLAASKKD